MKLNTIKYGILLLGSLAFLGTASAQSSSATKMAGPDTLTLFRSGDNGYANYRIPAIVTTKKGTLLAFCEGRKKPGDAGNIDLLYKRSTDGGKSWSKQSIIWDDGDNTCGNPCPVVDLETGTIWLLMTHNLGEDSEAKIIANAVRDSRTVWISKSSDDGLSWSSPVNITRTTKDTSWGWYATGPGIGIQIKNGPHEGRLVIPCDHSYADPKGHLRGGTYEYGVHIIYSDDHGKTWKLGGTIRPKVNECQVVEVADGNGTLLMNMRSYFGRHCRTQSVSYDGGASWTSPKDVPDLVEPVCQASIIRYSWPGKHTKNILLFLNPASTSGRHNMAIRVSYDDGKSWPVIRTLYPGPSAYSCMTVLENGGIGCLYEAGRKSPYERIVFEKLKPKEIFK
jgi:sialidase-1